MALAGEIGGTVTALLRQFLTFVFGREKRFLTPFPTRNRRMHIMNDVTELQNSITQLDKKKRLTLLHWLSQQVNTEQGWGREQERHATIRAELNIPKAPPPLPSSEAEFYLSQYEEHTEQGRHLETERSTMTNIVGAVAAAIIVFMGTKEFDPHRLSWLAPLTPLTLTALGIYGYTMSEELYARFLKHMDLAYGFRYVLETRLPAHTATDLHKIVGEIPEHKKDVAIHNLWRAFHLAIAISGIVLAVWILWTLNWPF
jgi:hypothetical protein